MFKHSIPVERRGSADNTACRRCSTDDRDWSTVGETSNATGDEKTQLMCVLACQPCKRGWSQVTYEATPSNTVCHPVLSWSSHSVRTTGSSPTPRLRPNPEACQLCTTTRPHTAIWRPQATRVCSSAQGSTPSNTLFEPMPMAAR